MLSRMMVPEMERKGYNRAFAAAITAGGSLVTPIIPPGIALIIYGLVADVLYRKNVYRWAGTWFAMRSRSDVYRLPGRPQN
ncbi:C4-dicarboxylate transporter large subunit [Escherichia coli]|uniref:C4-dicarboxylate transporter large subunit n=1 Tax=Escherichia coli TaxID=562 RepID=A0A2X1N0T1_ECOLX|nr:C4-dicarboxylate transporter large subunit [Escherichia coli]